MKAKVLNPGCFGEELELEGTPEEIAAFFKARRTAPQVTPPVFVPYFEIYDVCPQGGAHEYPQSWLSVTAPQCTKCGRVSAAPPTWTVSMDSEVSLNPMPPCRTEIAVGTYTYNPGNCPGIATKTEVLR